AGRVKAGALAIGPWPANPQYVFVGATTLDQGLPGNYALLQGASGTETGFTFLNSPSSIHFRIGNSERAVIDTTGHFTITHGSLTVGGSDIYFTETTHTHTGIGNAVGNAAIENAANYGALMIL